MMPRMATHLLPRRCGRGMAEMSSRTASVAWLWAAAGRSDSGRDVKEASAKGGGCQSMVAKACPRTPVE